MTIDILNIELEEFPVMITNIPGKGRGIVAKSNIFAGTVYMKHSVENTKKMQNNPYRC